MSEKTIVLSGIRATGRMHFGNLLGALLDFVKLSQDPEKQCYFFVANGHTLTTGIGKTHAKDMDDAIVGIVLDFLAAGIDPERSVIFAQSSVPETFELAWILQCMVGVNELDGMAQFQDKAARLRESGARVSEGLRAYPVLMAADILGPRANLVPVGADQQPHVELARVLARRFNTTFGTKLFPVPELLEGAGLRVPSLQKGKMGKSEASDATIFLGDDPKMVWDKVRRGMTDPARARRTDSGNPQNCPIFSLHQLVSKPETILWAQTGCTTAGIGCAECKKPVSDRISHLLAPIQERRRELESRHPAKEYALEILQNGGVQARTVIADTVAQAKELAGMRFY